MAQGNITIEFKPKGDKQLIAAIKQLDVVTRRLRGTVSKYEKEVEETIRAQKRYRVQLNKNNKTTVLGIKNNRLLSNSFATIRSKLLLLSFATALVVGAFRKLSDAAIEQERVEKKLEHQLGRVSKELLNYASGLQATTKFGDEAIINVQGMIAAFTKDEEQIKLATKATLDLAEAKGMDLKTAGDLVSKTLGSSTNALARYGIEVSGSANSILRLESLTRNISTLFAGEAASAANTFGGRVQQMSNSVGDASEAIGNYFTPILDRVVGFLKDAADSTKEFFNRLNETELETMVRRFEEMGVSAKEIANIKNFVINQEIEELNKKIEETGTSFTTVKQVRDEIAKQDLLTSTQIIAKEVDKQTRNQKFLNALIQTQKLIEEDSIEIKKGRVQLLDEEGNKLGIIRANEIEGKILTFQNIVSQKNQNKQMDIAVKKSEEVVDSTIKQGDNLLEILTLLQKRKELQDQINNSGKDDPILKLTIEDMQNYTETWSKSIMNVRNEYLKLAQAQLNADKANEISAANSIRSERLRQREIDKINKEYAAKQAEINERVKRAKRTQTVINTATSIMEVWSDEEMSNWGKALMSVMVARLGAAQLRTIDAAKYEQGGLVGGRRHSQGGTMIEAERGEYVISRRGVEAAGIEALNRINAGGGGGISVSINNPILSKDVVEDDLIPQIKEAIRRGADIGVG
jgi:hypothetical protein